MSQEANLDEYDLDYTGDSGVDSSVQNLEPTVEASQEAQQPVEQEATSSGEQSPDLADAPASNGEQPVEVKPDDDIESLRQQLAAAQMEVLQLRNFSSQAAQTTQPQMPAQPQPQQTAQPTIQAAFPQQANQISNVDFLQGKGYEEYLADNDSFNRLLNTVATVAYNAAVTAAQERILRQIPQVVETSANQQIQIKGIVDDFYTAHKDLEPYKPAVSMAAIKLHNENPSMPLAELLNKAADETRKFLRMRPGAPARQRVPARPVGSGGGARPTNQFEGLSDQEQQIMDLLS